MNGFLDRSLVVALLLLSVGYAVYSLGPRALRRRWMTALAGLLARAPGLVGVALSRRLAAGAASKTAGACGGCDNCGAETAPKAHTDDLAGSPRGGPAEIRIPIGKIGRRN